MGGVKTMVEVLYTGLPHACKENEKPVRFYSRIASSVPLSKEMAARLLQLEHAKVGVWVIQPCIESWAKDPIGVPVYDVFTIPFCSSSAYRKWSLQKQRMLLNRLHDGAQFDFFVEKDHPTMTLEAAGFVIDLPETAAFNKNNVALVLDTNFEAILQPLFTNWFTGAFSRQENSERIICYAPIDAVESYIDPYTQRTIFQFFDRRGKVVAIWHRTWDGNQHIHLSDDLPKESHRYFFQAKMRLIHREQELTEQARLLGEAFANTLKERLSMEERDQGFGICLN